MQDEQAIINRASRGDTSAFGQLVDHYRDYVFTIAFRILQKREEAEEAAQDAFVKAWKMLGSFKGTSKFSTWLYSIANHTAIDHQRKKQLLTESIDKEGSFIQVEDSGALNAQERLEERERVGSLDKALSLLHEQDALLITLFYMHEKSVDEIATITGLSVSNVKVKMFRARAKLKSVISNQ